MGYMFSYSGYRHVKPSVERSIDRQNLDNLHEDVVSNPKKLNMSESTRKVLSMKPDQGPSIKKIKEYLGGKSKRKTRKKHRKKK